MKIAVHKNTKCIVTGGSQGLGFAIAEMLVAKGCQDIILAARDPERVATQLRSLPIKVPQYISKKQICQTRKAFSLWLTLRKIRWGK